MKATNAEICEVLNIIAEEDISRRLPCGGRFYDWCVDTYSSDVLVNWLKIPVTIERADILREFNRGPKHTIRFVNDRLLSCIRATYKILTVRRDLPPERMTDQTEYEDGFVA